MACSTRSRVAGRRLFWPLITRETVWCETPASRATSAITGVFWAEAAGGGSRRGRHRGEVGHGCRRVIRRWMTTNTSSSAPMVIFVHQELRVPSKEMKVWMVPSTSTPSSEPTT